MMEICDWTSETVPSSSELEVCEWSDEPSNSPQLLTSTRKRTFSELDHNSRAGEGDTNTWDELEWSTSCSSVENLFAQSQCTPQISTPPADSSATVLSIASSTSSMPKSRCETPIRSVTNTYYDTLTPAVPSRRSPRLLNKYRKTSVDGSLLNNNFTEDKWQLFSVMKLNGCAEACATNVHELSEFDILQAHARFCSKSSHQEKRQWLFDYCATHCPLTNFGEKDPSKMTFVLSGREVCQPLWLATLSVSSSRFYEIRKEFMSGGQSQLSTKKGRSPSTKTLQAIAWMTSYFERIGDKRPDKDGIYLPTCLTVKSMYGHMIESLYKDDEENAVCFSQFSNLYRTEFPNVSIPKV